MVEDLSMRGDRGCGQIASCQTSLLVANKVIEYISTRSMLEGRRQFLQPTVPWELVGKAEYTGRNLRFNPCEVNACTLEIRSFGIQGSVGRKRRPSTVKSNRIRPGPARITPPEIDLRPMATLQSSYTLHRARMKSLLRVRN